jgi:hypothetical protein
MYSNIVKFVIVRYSWLDTLYSVLFAYIKCVLHDVKGDVNKPLRS